MDGGVRSATSADLAGGCKTAVILAPTIGPNDAIAKNSVGPLNRELQTLRNSGCNAELIVPDDASLKAFGATPGDETTALQRSTEVVSKDEAKLARLPSSGAIE